MRLGPVHVIRDSTFERLIRLEDLPPHSLMHSAQRARTLPIHFTSPDEWNQKSQSAVERCVRAFQRAERDRRDLAPCLWDFIENNLFRSFKEALAAGNLRAVHEWLSGMFLTPLTCGVAKKWTDDLEDIRRRPETSDYQVRLTDGILNLGLAVGAARRSCIEQQSATGRIWDLDYDVESLVMATEQMSGLDISHYEAGGCFGYRIGSKIVNSDSVHHSYTVHRLLQQGASPQNSIIEIGGGYGCLASLFARAGFRNYAIYDLHYVNVLQGYFLLMALPERSIQLYGESDGEIRILPHWLFDQIPSRSVDFVINTDSMPEMGASTAENYISGIHRILKGLFLSINQESGSVPIHAGVRYEPQNRIQDLVRKHGKYTCLLRCPWWMRQGYVEEIYQVRD